MTPEKVHLALNHFVFLLPVAALIPLIVGVVVRNRTTLYSGIGIALVGSLMTGLVMGSGEEAYERYEDGPVAAYLDPGAEEALDRHEDLAESWSFVPYALAVVSVLALIVVTVRRSWLRPIGVVMILFCLASIGAGLVIADSGGKIRRPDFRSESQLSGGGESNPKKDYRDHDDGDAD